ncbi:MAG: glycosyl transferase [Bacteroidota bacterium]|nr:glycosyl transferase [Bacteroidota bacterium]
MKIFYAVQATGNGHIARAMELMPYLQQYGTVDVFLSGSNSNLQAALPVKYRSNGVSLFYGNKGGLDYLKMLKAFSPLQVWKEARELPVEQYDVVINDFESITAMACKLKNVPSINFGHQASFISAATPRPAKKDIAGEWILKNYAQATSYVGLHFERYDDFIFSPVIKDDILQADVKDKGHITVYLSHYSDEVVSNSLQAIQDIRFEVFSKKVKQPVTQGNITFIPVNGKAFNESMIYAHGVITGAGFETPAEALYMGKKLMCLPIKGQYEQLCNAASLQRLQVPVIDSITHSFGTEVKNWLQQDAPSALQLSHSTYEIVQQVMEKARAMKQSAITQPLLTDEDFLVMG